MFLRPLYLTKCLWLILFGINIIPENFLIKYKTTADDCFVNDVHDTYKYKNIFNKDLKFEVDCVTIGDTKMEQDPNSIPKTTTMNTNGQCHLKFNNQYTGVCSFTEDPVFYEYPSLTRLEPGAVGDIKEIKLKHGVVHKLITKSIMPPLFEIPSFLSSKECDYIVSKAIENGMGVSGVVGIDINKELGGDRNIADIARVSQTGWMVKQTLGEAVWLKLRRRVSKLTQLPLEAIKRSEGIQVVHYQPGGHYHAHMDTTEDYSLYGLPCCFQRDCSDIQDTPDWFSCCRICRYITLVVYLNDVEEGGETAFPLANMDDSTLQETMAIGNWSIDLSRNCYNASLLVKPEKGKAVLWYNHEIGDKGYLGMAINQSYHGGCDVIRGSKWIANFWIPWPTFEDRFGTSRFVGEAL